MDQPTQPPTTTKEKLSADTIAYRKLVRSIEKPLGRRYLEVCSHAQKIELSRLTKSGMTMQEAKDAHSDYSDWVFGEVIRAFLEMED